MAKLKCEMHERRVFVIDTKVIHRNDGTQCVPGSYPAQAMLKIGDKRYNRFNPHFHA